MKFFDETKNNIITYRTANQKLKHPTLIVSFFESWDEVPFHRFSNSDWTLLRDAKIVHEDGWFVMTGINSDVVHVSHGQEYLKYVADDYHDMAPKDIDIILTPYNNLNFSWKFPWISRDKGETTTYRYTGETGFYIRKSQDVGIRKLFQFAIFTDFEEL